MDTSRPNPLLGPGGHKFVCGEIGWAEYALSLPDALDLEQVRGMRLVFEASARTAHRRIGWPRTWHNAATSYPQTEARKEPTSLTVSLNGVEIGAIVLPDDPADARGVLSAHLYENFEYASYGFLLQLEPDVETLNRIRKAAQNGEIIVRLDVPRATGGAGFNLYGERMGAFPLDPTLFLECE